MTEQERVLAAYEAMDERRKREYLELGEVWAKAHPEKCKQQKNGLFLAVNNRER